MAYNGPNSIGQKLPISRRMLLGTLAGAGLVQLTWRGRALAADDLLVFDFTGYEAPELHQGYIRKYGHSPSISVYPDTIEAFQKLQGGFTPDLVHPNSWDMTRFREAGLIVPWDVTRLSNWPEVFPVLANAPGATHDGKQWLITTDWGITSVLYRTDLVQPGEESWNILWDKRYAGKLSNVKDVDAAILGAALTLGIDDPFHASDEDFNRIRDKLTEQRPLLRFYWSDPTELEQAIASGEVVASYAWPASYSNLKAQGVPVAYMSPKEGVYSWMTGFARLAKSPGKEQNAYDYVDAWLAPESGKWMIENLGYGHSNRKSFDLVSPEVLKAKGLGDPDRILAAAHPTLEMDEDLRGRYTRMYEAVMSGM
jgi:spermidine/putrescine transport system substrate-binding protein